MRRGEGDRVHPTHTHGALLGEGIDSGIAPARQVDGVDVIVGSRVGPQTYGFLDRPWVVGRTILSVAGNDMAAVGQLDLVVRRGDRRIVRFGFRRHVVRPDGPASPTVKAVLDGYLAERPR